MAQSHAIAGKSGMELFSTRLSTNRPHSDAEREALDLTGLLPDVVESEDMQLKRVLQQLGHKTTDIDRYIYLIGLLDHDETLFYRTLMSDPGALHADRLRPDRRRGLPEVRPHLPPPARHVPLDQTQGPHKRDPAQLAGEGRALHLRHRAASASSAWATSAPTAWAFRSASCSSTPPAPACRRSSAADAPRCRHQQREPAHRSALSRPPADAALGDGARRVRGRVRRAVQEVFPSCCIHFEDWAGVDAIRLLARYRDKCAASTTTSRARPAPRSPACSARCASPARADGPALAVSRRRLGRHRHRRLIVEGMMLEGLSATRRRRASRCSTSTAC